MRAYLPAARAPEIADRTARAAKWLRAARPRETEEQAYQLLGLYWAGAPAPERRALADRLAASQRADGGWAQTTSRGSDAYATGEVLVALRRAGGLAPTDARIRRGLGYLLGHQESDGSWRVETRLHEQALVSPPHFETGFPHGEHQMISCMGTAWAAMALLEALPALAAPPPPLVDPEEWALPQEAPWMATALFGSRADLAALLDAGMPPDQATPDGTTALMMAAPDTEKMSLLLDRGAGVNKAAASGFTPLIVAANHRGATLAVRLLLDRGALVQPTDPKPAHDASPIFYAVWTGNDEATRLLIDRGASASTRMLVGGFIPLPALEMAVAQGDDAVVRTLAGHGADVNQVDDGGISMLTAAVLINHIGVAHTLIALGARPDDRDEHDMTALMHAASIDFGDTGMIDLLLASGADPAARTRDGQTALDLARKYGHQAQVRRLERARPRS